MAGTPYWRERKLVTSSSERKPSFTRTDPRRSFHLASFCVLSACSNCSGEMTFSLTKRSPRRCDIPRYTYRSSDLLNRDCRLRPEALNALASGRKREFQSSAKLMLSDTNCQ